MHRLFERIWLRRPPEKARVHGELDLDAGLDSFFPALPNARAMTIRHLLNQSSGLHNYPNTLEHRWPLRGAVETATILEVLATDKPDFAPGTRFAYSNSNYAVLSGIIEKRSGGTYARFLRERIFEPLGMSRSGYGHALQSAGDVAAVAGLRSWTWRAGIRRF